ncbi:uncharacterized protein [Drosophila kikkawai]|uniref:DUF7775 domain-containing protein n=1 Tax=Drosophila kikkawai TaxID=30033 RepID=A0A6P4IFE4_DROKI|nr:uncharacterized protein LOC108074144 [Drosophila kikkawai]
MNQVWVFFKLIEVVLGSMCMFFHVKGSLYSAEPIPHVLIYCATFMSFVLIAALGAFRLLISQSSVLSTQLLLTVSAVILHYLCALLIMHTAMKDPHLAAINNTVEYMAHPHFAYCKQQSIASLLTGTMYLMHMFHVLDLLLRLEPGDWRRQAVGRFNNRGFSEVGGRAGLYVLTKPFDNFLCRHCRCYYLLATSQVLTFQIEEMENFRTVDRIWQFLGNVRLKLCTVSTVESDESFMSTPSITSSSESEEYEEFGVEEEEQGRGKGRKTAAGNWRGPSDSSSLWAQIEDRSTLAKTRSSHTSEATVRTAVTDRSRRRSSSVWDDPENREKSEILLVEQSSHILGRESEEPRKSARESTVRFRAENNADEEIQSPRSSNSKLKPRSSKSETAEEKKEDLEFPEKPKEWK